MNLLFFFFFLHQITANSNSLTVSPPFGKAFAEVYRLNFWNTVSQTDRNELNKIPLSFGHLGIALTHIYGARNARLAVQHYSDASLTHQGSNYNAIWNSLWNIEYHAFAAFNEWNNQRTPESWTKLVESIYDVYFGSDGLSQYANLITSDEFQSKIKLILHATSGYGIKNFVPAIAYDKDKLVTLNNGYKMPVIGFGSWMLTGDRCKNALHMALKNGYRLIDTSQNYNNEKEIGEVIKESGIIREEIFIMDKISFNQDFGRGATRKAFMKQLETLGLDYIDLYMTHGAIGDKNRLKGAWEDMEDLYKEGKIKALGVSNYDVSDLKQLMSYAKIKPTFVQNKYDPFTQGGQAPWVAPILEYARENDIIVQGYCSLNAWPHQIPSYWDAHVQNIAFRYENKSSAQIVIRWALQNGISLLVRSENEERQLQNLNVFDFELDQYDMQLLNGLITLYSPYDIEWVNDVYEQLVRPGTTHADL